MRTHLQLILAFTFVLALAACQPTASEVRPGGALIVRDGDLWRYEIGGRRLTSLTEDDALQWRTLESGGGSPEDELRCCAPSVSPDGSWLAYSPHSGYFSPGGEDTPLVNEPPYLVLQAVAGDAPAQVIEDTRRAVWAPD